MIFDLDGTLVDSMPIHGEAWMEVLPKFGLKLDPARLLVIGGMPAPKIVALLAQEQNVNVNPGEVAAAKAEAYLRKIERVQPIDPIIQIARRWHDHIPLAIATGSNHHTTSILLELLGIKWLFSSIITYEEVTRPKPYPDLYLKAAQNIKVEPMRCLGFEDTPIGIKGLRAAGMHAVYVPHFLKRYRSLYPEKVTPSPSPLSSILSAWYQ